MNVLTIRGSSRLVASLMLLLGANAFAACPDVLNHEMRKLRSKETVQLCEAYAGKPVLMINTASHCGFTPQFKGLEALYQQYKDQGLVVAGFPSDSFNQEADSEEKTAQKLWINTVQNAKKQGLSQKTISDGRVPFHSA